MSVLFSNNAATTLSSGISNSATSITVADGSVFPTIAGSDYFYLTLEVASDASLKEIVKCTARSGNTLTIARAQDNSTARAFSSSDKAELRLTAAGLNDVAAQADTDTNTTYSIQDGELSQNNFTDADHTKLNNIETAATADQTDAEIRAAVEAATNSNVFTDADHTKLNGIAASANNYTLPFTDNSTEWDTSYTYSQVGHLPLSGGILTGDLTVSSTGFFKLPVGTTAQRSNSPATGMIRFNSTTNQLEQYASSAWSSVGSAADFRLNSFTGNGSTTAFTLSTNPVEDNTLVYIDGVYQNKTSYSIVTNVLTFSDAPDAGAVIEITAATAAPVEASTEFKLSQFSGDGSTTVFTLSAQTPENNTSIYIDGVYQSKANYSVSGTTLTFSAAPPNGTSIEVMAAHAVIVSTTVPNDGTVTTAKLDSVLAGRISDLEDEILLNLGV